MGLVALSALAPVSVQLHATGDTVATVTAADGTRIEVFAGTGEYAFITRGCNGSILSQRPVTFRDAGAAVEQRLGRSGLSAGVRGGWMRDDIAGIANVDPYAGTVTDERIQIENRYANPYLTFERSRGSVGFGWVWHDKEFISATGGMHDETDRALNDVSWHLRIGSDRRYFAVRWMEAVPLYSGGGYLLIGLGGRPGGGALSLYRGMGAGGPYEGAGLLIQSDYRLPSGITAGVRSRLGYSGNHGASGVSIGVGYGTPRP